METWIVVLQVNDVYFSFFGFIKATVHYLPFLALSVMKDLERSEKAY